MVESRLEEASVVVGIDWADREHVAWVVDRRSGKATLERIEHERLHDYLAGLQGRAGGGRVAIGIEQSRGPVVWAMMAYEGIDIYPINPVMLRRMADAQRVSRAKDDPTDAQVAYEILEKHPNWVRRWVPDEASTRALRLLCEMRKKKVEQRTALTNEITDALKQYYPQALSCGGGFETRLFPVFLRTYPSVIALRENSGTLAVFYRQNRCCERRVIEQRVAIASKARELTTDRAVIESYRLLVETSLPQLEALNAAIAQFETQIAQLWQSHPDREVFASFGGAGAALAPRLATVFGDRRDRWTDAEAMQEFSGIAPVKVQSGPVWSIHMRWQCPTFVKQTFHEFAAHSIAKSSWARAFYISARNRGMGHHAAVRGLAYRWIRILFRCWQSRTKYDESRYIESLKRSGSPLAAMLVA